MSYINETPLSLYDIRLYCLKFGKIFKTAVFTTLPDLLHQLQSIEPSSICI